ncbi:YicC family protein [bacterium]|nr:YicC family protein [bacterium]
MPTYSMTGFGRAEDSREIGAFAVEAKSVNHRFLEPRVHLPRELSWLELPLTRLIKERLIRGKVDASIRWTPAPEYQPRASFNRAILADYERQTADLAEFLEREEAVSLEYLLQLPGVAEAASPIMEEEAVQDLAISALNQALDALIEERRREGEALEKEIRLRLSNLEEMRTSIESRREEVVETYRQRLRKKAEEWAQTASVEIDAGRLESEILLYAERSDITEELVRLDTHIDAFVQAFDASGEAAQGRSMEFLAQELLRETNTIGSKARDTSIATLVLTMKNEIEKIREQILNVE